MDNPGLLLGSTWLELGLLLSRLGTGLGKTTVHMKQGTPRTERYQKMIGPNTGYGQMEFSIENRGEDDLGQGWCIYIPYVFW